MERPRRLSGDRLCEPQWSLCFALLAGSVAVPITGWCGLKEVIMTQRVLPATPVLQRLAAVAVLAVIFINLKKKKSFFRQISLCSLDVLELTL